jgi:S-formylglutathione hydrolase FrmB
MLTISSDTRKLRPFLGFLAFVAWSAGARADLPARASATGSEVAQVEVAEAKVPRAWRTVAWSDLSTQRLTPGAYVLRVRVPSREGVEALEWPVCAGRGRILVDGVPAPPPAIAGAPVVVALPRGADHEVVVEIAVSGYEHRVACGQPPRVGTVKQTAEGLGVLTFASPRAASGGGRAVYFLPPGHDAKKPAALLVGTHPWNGGIWTYAAYAELLREAARKDVVLLMPSGLGNSLYTASAEEEVLAAIDALSAQVAIDPKRVSIWGASMGGAGATTIGFHHPDRFALVVSFFGDSKYDITTYVRSILPTESAAHLVNALDVVDNARYLPVWLVHGEDDLVSPIEQSAMLYRAMTERKLNVRFDRVAHAGHEGALVAKWLAEVVDKAAEARAVDRPARVTYRSVRPSDTGAYGVRIVRDAAAGDAFVDVERRPDGVHVLRAMNVKSIVLARGALGSAADAPPPIVIDPAAGAIEVKWEGP